MTSVTEAALAASVILGMISIPAVSETTVNQNPASQPVPDIGSSDSTPRKMTQTTSSNGFHAQIETAMEDFSTFVSSEGANATLENPSSELRVSRSADGVKWMLQTPGGRLEIRQTATRTVQVTETPDGTLKRTREGSTVKTSFTGADRQKVEKTRNELEELMESKKKRLDQKRKRLKDSATPEVEVIANESTASGYGNNTEEHVVIVNHGAEKVDLEGWKLQNDNPDTYTFVTVTLESGESLKAYTEDEEELEDVEENAVTGTDLSWENTGDKATLENSDGMEIDSQEY